MEKTKKTTVFVLVASILIVSLGVAYAYWSAIIEGQGSPMTFETEDLRIIFNESADVTGEDKITPGWRYTKTFTVENKSSGSFNFDIVIKNLVNTFVTDSLKYKITSRDGYNMTDYKTIPKSSTASDKVLVYSAEISGATTQHYTIEFYYEDLADVDQSEDVGKKFGGSLGVVEGIIDGPLYEVLTSGKIYTVDSTRNTNATEPIEGETLVEGYNSTRKIYMTNKVSETEDGSTDNPIYYFAGNPSDNWVKFAGFYWRIIRTNATHGVKLLYAGTSPDTTEGYIGTGKWGSSSSSIKYNNALFKSDLESWYTTNISKYDTLISTTANYCNDTSYTTAVSDSSNIKEYGAYTRLITNKTPTYKCPNDSDKLSIKAGLMTGDEVAFAGGAWNKAAPNTYYYRNSANGSVTGSRSWWTMSPSRMYTSDAFYVMEVRGSIFTNFGSLYNNDMSNNSVLRPVITLAPEVEVKSGTGTDNDPYKLEGTED